MEIKSLPSMFENCAVLKLTGELDLHSAEKFKAAAEELIDWLNSRGKPPILMVDVSDMTFIDSSGLGAFLGRYRSLRLKNGELVLIAPRPQVANTFELAGLSRVLRVYENIDEAFLLLKGEQVL